MKHCVTWRQLVYERIVSLVCGFTIAAFFAAAAVVSAGQKGFFSIVMPAICGCVAIFTLLLCCSTAIWLGRRYSIDKCGITVSYCNRFRMFYPWNMFQRIVVCDISHAGKDPGICHLVIRLAPDNEEYGPLSKKRQYARPYIDRWRGDWYTFVRFRKIICITFSPERLEEIQQLSKLPVLYSLTIYGREAYEAKQKTGQWDR